MTADPTQPRDRGFTLVELLIVVFVLGMVMTVLAAAFVVIVKATPSAQARTDDVWSLNNLTTWLSKDVSSTEETGFVKGNVASGCTGVPASTGLLQLRWSEGSTTYMTNYRYVPTGPGTGAVHRFSCKMGQLATDLKLTPDLHDVSTGSLAPAPVDIQLVPTTNGNPGYKGLQFVVTVLDENGVPRELLSLDATTTNVHSTLPLPGGGLGNVNDPPTADPGSTAVILGQSVNFDLDPLVNDPEGEALTVTVDASTLPPDLVVTPPVTGTTILTITAPADALLVPPGVYTFAYTVTDPGTAPGPLSDSSTVDVTVVDPNGNHPPTANAASTDATRGVPVVVPLTVSDQEDGTNVTINVPPMAGWGIAVNGLNVTITPPANVAATTVIPYTATDSDPVSPATTDSTITVHVCTVTIDSITNNPVNVFTNGANIGKLQKDVEVTISTNNACTGPLVLAFKPKAADTVETTIVFGTTKKATIDKSAYTWDTSPVTRNVTLNVRQAANGTIEASGTLQVRA